MRRKIDDNWWKNTIDSALSNIKGNATFFAGDDSSEESEESKEQPKKKKLVAPRKKSGLRSRSRSRRNSRKSSMVYEEPASEYDAEDEELFRTVSRRIIKKKQLAAEEQD